MSLSAGQWFTPWIVQSQVKQPGPGIDVAWGNTAGKAQVKDKESPIILYISLHKWYLH